MDPKIGPPMWQAEAHTELTLSASPVTAVGQSKLALDRLDYGTYQRGMLALEPEGEDEGTQRP